MPRKRQAKPQRTYRICIVRIECNCPFSFVLQQIGLAVGEESNGQTKADKAIIDANKDMATATAKTEAGKKAGSADVKAAAGK